MSNSRWGDNLSYADAEALASQFNEGHRLPLSKMWEMLADKVREWIDEDDYKTRYGKLGEIRAHMKDMGLTELEEEVDDGILAESICEHECSRKCGGKTGPDVDECFWTCMRECSPNAIDYAAAEASAVDSDMITTTYSIAPSGLLLPKNITKDGV